MSSVLERPETSQAQDQDVDDKPLFRDLPLPLELQLAVEKSGYISPTPVQLQIIPIMLAGHDLLAQSQTGTGKTAAFALPILANLEPTKSGKPQVLVLAPTRELATQVAKSFETYGANLPQLRTATICGGSDYDSQLRKLKRGVHIVVGTPGRVIDHIKRGTLQLDGIRCLVLDEADEMLNMGFLEDVEFVLQGTPEEKQVALFSATMPDPIRKIAGQNLKNPKTITIKRKTLTADSIEQKCVFVEERNKRELLARLLEVEETDGVIVFVKTKDATVSVAEYLTHLGLKANALNGDLPQARRQRTVDQLKAGKLDILVATDVAARGLDVQRVSHVFNFDLPQDGESYVHRIGRTGRAGRKGIAVNFLTQRQRGKLRLIEKLTQKSIAVIEQPTANDINVARIRKFKDAITAASKCADHALYQKVIQEHATETEQSLETIAAALAHLAQGGRPLLAKDLPARPHREDRERNREDRERNRDNDRPRGERRSFSRESRAPEAGMQRYWIGVGHNDGVRPKNIVGAIANEAGIPGNEIGPIKIRDACSTIDLPAGLPANVLEVLRSTWVAGKQLKIRIFTEKPPKHFDKEGPGKKKFSKKKFKKDPRAKHGSDKPLAGKKKSAAKKKPLKKNKRN